MKKYTERRVEMKIGSHVSNNGFRMLLKPLNYLPLFNVDFNKVLLYSFEFAIYSITSFGTSFADS